MGMIILMMNQPYMMSVIIQLMTMFMYHTSHPHLLRKKNTYDPITQQAKTTQHMTQDCIPKIKLKATAKIIKIHMEIRN